MTKDDDGVGIRAYFRAAKASDGFRQRDAGVIIWIDVTNVEDDDATAGTATTSNRAPRHHVRAGSNR